MNCFRSTLWNVRNNLGIGAAEAAQSCGVTMATYLAVERGEDSPTPSTYAAKITAEHGMPCGRCGVPCALFVEERATATAPAFLHCGCVKVSQ